MKTGRAKSLGATGGRSVPAFLREVLYVPHQDVVLTGTRRMLGDGKLYWLVYDCGENTWVGVHLGGGSPMGGRKPAAEHSVSLGLSYDPKRKLVWVADARMTVHALRLDLASARVRPLGELPGPKRRD